MPAIAEAPITQDTIEQAARVLLQLRRDKKETEKTIDGLVEQIKSFLGTATEWIGQTVALKIQSAETLKVDSEYVLSKATADEIRTILQHATVDRTWFNEWVKETHPEWSSYQYLKVTANVHKLLVNEK